ncbi:MAG: preprotein translocase subunit SecA [Candidatus Pacebacteria bacterium]|jgi:preprotein translocase subunit SecA|nr:preprotein translocase subunit SecA [Candidatus Paceibacterota bacterium]MBT3511715.1 preprotein translocase subunit SecA [Candidatus Paceibacterota bacterium]MBT4005144.1 preprotein translocase subunit SecA [Candidatus Paceibacterota bacterium]MBT4358601.1 preprotein translocase subunit SecA [Candidatus Paceibacterota bacterium]MBT4680741.1 preprotein translocase subunit SecA [Candidatus Paceibacterota bacterium]
MFKFITKLFDQHQKMLDENQAIVEQINALEPQIKKLTDKKLAAQTAKFKKIIKEEVEQGKDEQDILNQLLPEAFATVRETSRRILSMRHFDVQLLAGVALHKGTITEQKTGEGKTLSVTAPLYLNSLLGKGAHLITVNDYLAEIGCGWMSPIYHFLGLSTSVVIHDESKLYNPEIDSEERGDERLEHFEKISRREAYATDITYGTNNEFGFDYLRDNMVQTLDNMVQRQNSAHHFVIVDEADSILIDEARTPLIISAPDIDLTEEYFRYSKMVHSLTSEVDYKIDEKAKTATLTDLGIKRIEQKLKVTNLYEESFDTIHHVEAALKAKTLYRRDKEYIVRENQVIIVDEHTGRLMYGRRYSDGLHQSIEAKEGVPIQKESRTMATISIQNYFRMYDKLSGMTGTAVTEAEEFNKIYDVAVLVVPTNKPIQRDDRPDLVYKTQAAKYSAIVKEAEQVHQEGRPILIGTRSIENNQIISNFLKRKKIPFNLLNAKNHEKEASVISNAGRKGAITVATNIAGRGVDIVLGGSKPELKDFRRKDGNGYKEKAYQKALDEWKRDHDEVVELGGLHIVGTERHESRRIDNQLRGRAGRQGDNGSSIFFLSLEDEIMRIFGGEQISKMMDFLKIEESQPIEHGMVSKAIESAQVKVEGFFFDQRKRLVDFDDVMNKHRDIIYKRRRRLLETTTDSNADTLKSQILEYIQNQIEALVSLHAPQDYSDDEYEILVNEFIKIIPFDEKSQQTLQKNLSELTEADEIKDKLMEIISQTYLKREKVVGREQMRQMEQVVTLSTIDEKWMDHLDEVESLREGIWLRGDKQTVLSEYKKEAFIMFEQLIHLVESTIANKIFRVQLGVQRSSRVNVQQAVAQKEDVNEPLAKEVADATVPSIKSSHKTTKGDISDLASVLGSAKGKTQVTGSTLKKAKIKRNDPCPCGSGLKYKKCGLIDAAKHQS